MTKHRDKNLHESYVIKSINKFMCRNIKTLYNYDPAPTQAEILAAAVQYVRKISGYQKPPAINQEAFDRAVNEISASSELLLTSMTTSTPPRDREVEAAKARERNKLRFGKSI